MQNVVDIFVALVGIDSPSYEEDRLALHLENELLSLGLSTAYDQGRNLYGFLPGEGEPLLFNAHMDTVALAVGANPVIKDGIISSDGTSALGADDKAAIAAILWALGQIKKKDFRHPPLTILFTTAEEEGLVGASKIQTEILGPVQWGYTLDVTGPVGLVVTGAAHHDMIEATFYGKAAHAGFEPEKGASAIMMASRAIDRMKLLRIDEETTANVGSFIAEGAKNIVSAEAKLVLEARSLKEDKLTTQTTAMKAALQEAASFYGGQVIITHTNMYGGYAHAPKSELVEHFRQACESLGLPFGTKTTLGGSDANILNALGIPTLAISSGYSDAHSTAEHIAITELEGLASLTLELMSL